VNFRSVNDLFATVRRESHKLPREIDLVVGVPRSGMLAATAVSLLLQRPLVDLNSFLEGRLYNDFTCTRRAVLQSDRRAPDFSSVLVIDDSIYEGATMREVRKSMQELPHKHEVVYAAVYGLHDTHPEVDIVLEKCSRPRVFEWNVLNHTNLKNMCVDLDGVLCLDPDDRQDDDGPNYLEFLNSAATLVVPRYRINSIVTARLEKYRAQTEAWLKANEIEYDNLFMLDLPSAAERRRTRAHAGFKSEIYRSKKDCWLFVESSTAQAREIRERSGKSVLAYQEMIYFSEGPTGMFRRSTTKSGFREVIKHLIPRRAKPIIKFVLRK
jgi:uncharacterized HAD superfamily protein/adenine/guanine phosphoribosyltransferase-like PRPP-binding protein